MTKQCSTCKYWVEEADEHIHPFKDFKDEDDYIEVPTTEHRQCLAALHHVADDAETSPMVSMDGSGYLSRLFTLPTHSCDEYEDQS